MTNIGQREILLETSTYLPRNLIETFSAILLSQKIQMTTSQTKWVSLGKIKILMINNFVLLTNFFTLAF